MHSSQGHPNSQQVGRIQARADGSRGALSPPNPTLPHPYSLPRPLGRGCPYLPEMQTQLHHPEGVSW